VSDLSKGTILRLGARGGGRRGGFGDLCVDERGLPYTKRKDRKGKGNRTEACTLSGRDSGGKSSKLDLSQGKRGEEKGENAQEKEKFDNVLKVKERKEATLQFRRPPKIKLTDKDKQSKGRREVEGKGKLIGIKGFRVLTK